MKDLHSQGSASDYIEDLSEHSGFDVWERLEDLRIDPIGINKAQKRDLLQIPWIDPFLAGRIIEYRKKKGGFTNLEELLEVEGVSESIYLRTVPYLKLDRKLDMMMRLDTRKKAEADDVKMKLTTSGGNFTSGLKAARYYDGASSLSGYLLTEVPFCRSASVLVGDMYLRLGQGLVSWSAFGALRSPDRPIVYPLAGGGLRGTTSIVGKNVQRGVAVKFSRDSFHITLSNTMARNGGGKRRINAVTCTVEPNERVRCEGSILSLGDGVLFTGGMLEFEFEAGTGFAEVVRRSPGGHSMLFGLQRTSASTSFLILYRRLSPDYLAPLGFDMSLGGTGMGNFEALYTGLMVGKGKTVELAFYRDIGRRIYTGRSYTPTRFDYLSISLKLRPFQRFTSRFSLRQEEDESHSGSGHRERQSRIRWDLTLRPASGLTLRTRTQLSRGKDGEENWQSSLYFAELRTRAPLGFDVRSRFTTYNCSDGGYLYIAEGGLPERSLIMRLSGEGETYQMVISKRIGDSWVARLKLSNVVRRRDKYERGFEFENWLAEYSTEFQLECRF
ncbi:MAG: ComEA family DNA-binding protein [Candidatus Glassbacteria bacterium]